MDDFTTRYYAKGRGKILVKKSANRSRGMEGRAEVYLKGDLHAIITRPWFGPTSYQNLNWGTGGVVPPCRHWEDALEFVLQLPADSVEYYGMGEWDTPKELLTAKEAGHAV